MKKYLGVLCAVLLTVACLVVPASAADAPVFDLSVCDSLPSSTVKYVEFLAPGGYYDVLVLDSRLDVVYNNPVVSFLVTNNTDSVLKFSWYEYKSSVWSKVSDFSFEPEQATNISTYSSSSFVVSSTFDIYDSNGDLFFQAPPPPQPGLGESVEELTVNQGTVLLQKVSGVMKILVPFGVGCLALLTALPVLRKVLGRFLPV